MEKNIIPVINTETLQQKANEYALKGAEEALKDFYSGYNSPYKKAIEENLKNKGLDNNFDIPDIVAVLNEKISEEVDLIANNAISKTFIPKIKKFLTREDAEFKFSDILKKFIDVTDFESNDIDHYDYTVDFECREGKTFSNATFFHFIISNGEVKYNLHFYRSKEVITIISLPRVEKTNDKHNSYSYNQKMTLTIGDAKLEMPFTRGVLEDDFVSLIARLVIGNNKIVFDTTDFSEDLFPNDHCHCD